VGLAWGWAGSRPPRARVPQVSGVGDGEPACRRGSVHRSLAGVRLGGHPSVRPTWGRVTGPVVPRFGLAPGGGCQPPGSPRTLVRSYRTVSPLPVRDRGPAIGGLLSVALSTDRSPRPGSRQHPALRSPDLPRHRTGARRRGHPAGSPSPSVWRASGELCRVAPAGRHNSTTFERAGERSRFSRARRGPRRCAGRPTAPRGRSRRRRRPSRPSCAPPGTDRGRGRPRRSRARCRPPTGR
jgi:hypothetical protein